ncbi:MAG: pilus assembly protein [Mesorhizobium sp.]|nr:MAG: pilus assembly protein [Mesorhizobium sp.]
MIRRFWASTRGNFALATAIAMVPLMLVVAGAVDVAGTSDDAAQLQNSLDAAGLAVGTKYQPTMSDAADAIDRGGSALLSAACVSTVGSTSGITPPNATLSCDAPLENQYASFDPLANVTPPAYGMCQSMPNGKTVTLSPGTYCDKTWSGKITLNPGVYILRNVTIKPGGNGSLTGQGVTIFLMEGSQLYINANEQVNLSPPASGAYAGITIFQAKGNTSALTINGGSGSVVSGFIYAPDAAISYAGNSDMNAQGNCLRLVGNTVGMTGNSAVKSDCAAELGNREMYAGRMITLVK